MIRKIIHIDEEKCNGCGACAEACHEGAIGMENGKAKLLRDDYCDGLGDCLPACPTGAITFEEREAAAYDEAAVMENRKRNMQAAGMTLPGGCPGSRSRSIERSGHQDERRNSPVSEDNRQAESELRQWPVQIRLAPVNAPYFDGAKLLIAADCTAYAYAAFHETFIRNHITLIGLSEAGRGGLFGKADGNHPQQQHQKREDRPDGGPLLRRDRTCGENSASEQRKIPALE